MLARIVRRGLHAVLLVAITLTVTFFVLRLAPGDPSGRYLADAADPADIARVERSLGLDDPLPVQFVRWASSFLTGDFGTSLDHHRPVRDMLAEAIPRTLLLASLALVLQIGLGVWVGAMAARHRHGALDALLSVLVTALFALPAFYLAYLLIGWFALDHAWFPTAGIGTPGLDRGEPGWLFDRIRHLVLPVCVLGIASAASFARFTRGSLIDALAQDYARTARAKGLTEAGVLWRHAFRDALPTLLTIAGLSTPFLIGGAVVVETVFAWPGMGALLIDAIGARDYPVVLAINFACACAVVAGSFFADVAVAWADPRARGDDAEDAT